ncbi:MAG: ribonuclease III [Candidatus Auribacterota bacterium]
MSSGESFFQLLKYTFRNNDLLEQALTHRSYAYEFSLPRVDNERLEFLGDAVIGCCVAEELFRLYPDYPEGKLSLVKSYLVSKKFLAILAKELKLGEALRLGSGEEKNGGRKRISLLGNAFEALTGAIYLDSDYETTRAFLLEHINSKMHTIEDHIVEQNLKNILQTYIQKNYGQLPRYDVKDETGPHHERTYVYAVYVGDKLLGEGSDSSKKKASSKAARDALRKLNVIE